jgi:hypothetical protein
MEKKRFIEPLKPVPPSLFSCVLRGALYTVASVVGIPIIMFVAVRNWTAFYLNVSSVFKPSIRANSKFKDEELQKKMWQSDIGQLYCEHLEYQKQEGYCAPTTVRVVLKSIPGIPAGRFPEMKSGGTIPDQVVQKIDSCGRTKSRTINGNDGFEAFFNVIKLANNTKYRISVNFLRSSLFGLPKPAFLPHNILLGLFGGHFSPVVGYNEELNLVMN